MPTLAPAPGRRDGRDGGTSETPPEKPTALVVESDVGSSSAVCGYLVELGFSVTAVASGVGAVIAARNSVPTVIFLAIQLRDATGADLVTWLRANPALARVPIVAMQTLGEDAPALEAGGFDARLKKPTSVAKVAQVIREACTGAS